MLTVNVDTDFAGCNKSRKSTSAGVVLLGKHVVKSWSSNQSVIAQSSAEAEYYGLVKGASVAIGVKSILADLGIQIVKPIQIKSDASAAIG